MRVWMLLVVAVAAVAVAAACTPRPAPAVPASSLRVIPKKLGEDAGWTTDEGSTVDFYLDKITVDPPCDQPRQGHVLVLDLRIATGDDGEALNEAHSVFDPAKFDVVDPNGMLQPATRSTCWHNTTDGFPLEYSPNQTYRAQVELDVANVTGALLLVAPMQNNDAWSWTIGNSVAGKA